MISLASVSDKNYLKYLDPCFKSFKINNKKINCFLYYVGSNNLSVQNTKILYDNQKLSSFKNIKKSITSEDNEFLKFFPSKKTLVSEKECYCNNIRFLFISNLLSKGIKNIIYTDADMICNKNIEFLKVLCYKKDIGLQQYYVDKNEKVCSNGSIRYRTNFMYINNTYKTKKLFLEISNKISKDYLFWGHVNIFTEFVKKQNDLSILSLPEDFIDTNYTPSSYIWSGESFRKHSSLVKNSSKNNKFLNALNTYK